MSILLYADDTILIAPSVTSLQQLLNICEQELEWLDMSLNAKKSTCIRISPRFNANCCNIVTRDGRELVVVTFFNNNFVNCKAISNYGYQKSTK